MVRYSEFFETSDKSEILKKFRTYFKVEGREVTIDDNGFVEVDGSCMMRSADSRITALPVKFSRVSRHLICDAENIKLETLVGSPRFVGADFDVTRCDLTSLEGGPDDVDNYYCTDNKLTSLKGIANTIRGEIYCDDNPLTSLEGLPKTFSGKIIISWHSELPLLRLLQCSRVGFTNYDEVGEILKKYKGNVSRSNILACQKELIKSGYASNASW